MALAEQHILPDEFFRWKALFHAHTQNNLRLTWKLVECTELLSNNGIECIVLKGPVYAIQAYGDLTLRQFSDLDILIHQVDFPKAYNLLEQSRYDPIFKLNDKQKKFQIWSAIHFSFYRQGDIFEVHWNIDPLRGIHHLAPEEIWQQLNSIHVFDQDFFTLSQENTILYTCIHGAKHGWTQLKWIVDLAFLSQSLSEKNWLVLMEHAKSKGLFRQVCLGLSLAVDTIDLELPLQILDELNRNRGAKQLAYQVKQSLSKRTNQPSPTDGYKFYLMSLERWQDRLHYMFGLIFIPEPNDWLKSSLPENLYFLYYLIRPIRLLIKYGKTAFSIDS